MSMNVERRSDRLRSAMGGAEIEDLTGLGMRTREVEEEVAGRRGFGARVEWDDFDLFCVLTGVWDGCADKGALDLVITGERASTYEWQKQAQGSA